MIELEPKWGQTVDSFFQLGLETDNRRLRERYMALAFLASGQTFNQVSARVGRRRQTIAHWVDRFNSLGLEGLRLEYRSKRPPILTDEEVSQLREVVTRPPKEHGIFAKKWRGRSVAALIMEKFGKEVHEETARRYLRLAKSRKNGPARHEPPDEPGEEAPHMLVNQACAPDEAAPMPVNQAADSGE